MVIFKTGFPLQKPALIFLTGMVAVLSGCSGADVRQPDTLAFSALPAGLSWDELNRNQEGFITVRQMAGINDLSPDLVLRPGGAGMSLVAARGLYEFDYQGFSVCDHSLRRSTLQDGSSFVLAGIPAVFTEEVVGEADFPDQGEAEEALLSTFPDGIEVQESRRCLYLQQGRLIPVRQLHFHPTGGVLQIALVGLEGILHQRPGTFHATGSARIYDTGPVGGKLQDYPLNNLVGGGLLKDDRFETRVEGGTALVQSDHQFVFDPSDDRFTEASLFVNANRMMDWFVDLGFKDYQTKSIVLMAHSTKAGKNNAFYEPSGPTIYIGDGDGEVLQNLGKDFDVLAHELSHHVIFEYLTSTQGESLTLHEGLADYFVFAKTSNNCLGESICPAEGALCWKPAECLRTGDNSLKTSDSKLTREGHWKGQVFSGMLWSLRSGGSFEGEFDKTVLQAIAYLPAQGTYDHFGKSLLVADRELNGSKNCQLILDALSSRGAGVEVTCAGLVDQKSPNGNTGTIGNPVATEKESGEAETESDTTSGSGRKVTSKETDTCGVVGGSSASGLLFWLFWGIPLGLAWLPVRKRF